MGIIKNVVVAGTVLLLTLNLIYVFIIPSFQPGSESTLRIKNLNASADGSIHYFDGGSGCDSFEPDDSIHFDVTSNSPIYEEIDLTFDFNVENVLRGGREYRRISMNGGGIECGAQGEERTFYQYSLKIPGNIDRITVELLDPRVVQNWGDYSFFLLCNSTSMKC